MPIRLPDPNSGLHLKRRDSVKVIRLMSQYGSGRQSHAVPLPFGYTQLDLSSWPSLIETTLWLMTVWLRTKGLVQVLTEPSFRHHLHHHRHLREAGLLPRYRLLANVRSSRASNVALSIHPKQGYKHHGPPP